MILKVNLGYLVGILKITVRGGAFKQSQIYTMEQLKKIYSELLELDQQLKSSGVSDALLFTRLIAHL